MSTVYLLPRLPLYIVDEILADLPLRPEKPAVGNLENHAECISYAATGGSRNERLAFELGNVLRQLAQDCGYPDNHSQAARSRFDALAAATLAQYPGLSEGEALRDDTWCCLATLIVPDVVTWRFGGKPAHRFAGGVRNAFQRLWMRGTTLDRGEHHSNRWALVAELTEDAMVQIFERPSIAANPRLAVAIAEVWVDTAGTVGNGAMEPIMRHATKLLRLRLEVEDFLCLDDQELKQQISRLFLQAREYLSS
jgi:hypothetical protein